MPRTRMTGFSRLLLFLLIFLPLAFIGASYYNGEDPIAKVKGFFGGESTRVDDYNNHRPDATPGNGNQPATFENVADLREEILDLKTRLAVAEEKLARCQTANVD